MGQPGDNIKSYERDTRQHYQQDTVARQYHNQFASGLSARNLSHLLVAKSEQRAVERLLSDIRSDIAFVADVPCGTGKLVPVFQRLSLTALGADVSGSMLRIAKELARDTAPAMRFTRLDITQLPFADQTFDAVVCLRLFHRVPREVTIAALRELYRVTRRYVVVSYGVETAWHSFRQVLRSLITPGRTIPYPIQRAQVNPFFTGLGWQIRRKLSPLPVLSAEEIALLVKVGV